MGKCVEKIAHSCGSGDGLQTFLKEDGTYDGYCFACSTYVSNPYNDKPVGFKPVLRGKTDEEKAEEVKVLGAYPNPPAIAARALKASSLKYFGVKVGVSEQDGSTLKEVYFPYRSNGEVIGYKARLLEKKVMWGVGTFKEVNMFGWNEAIISGEPRLYITEGEFDAVALFQALKSKNLGTQWEDRNPAVVSLSRGAGYASKDIAAHLKEIKDRFKDVVLVFDNDDPGKKAVEEVRKILPNVQVVTLGMKDANEMVVHGHSKALANAVVFTANRVKNTRIKSLDDCYELGMQEAQWGLSTPFAKLTDLTRGFRFGETYYIGAGVKMGKSDVLNTLAAHFIKEHDVKVFLAKPEEAVRKTIKLLYGKLVGKKFHDPKVPFDMQAYKEAAEIAKGKVQYLEVYQLLRWEELKNDIRDAVVTKGCRVVFIDPITNLTNGISSGEANTVLQEMAQEVAAMALELDIIIFLFCHLKAPDSGPAHERGGKVMSHQFAGSRAMMRSCNYMLGLEGNKDPDTPLEERNVRKLVLLEDREFGNVGSLRIYWDENTTLFTELPEDAQ